MNQFEEYAKDPQGWLIKESRDFQRKKEDARNWYDQKMFEIHTEFEQRLAKAAWWQDFLYYLDLLEEEIK